MQGNILVYNHVRNLSTKNVFDEMGHDILFTTLLKVIACEITGIYGYIPSQIGNEEIAYIEVRLTADTLFNMSIDPADSVYDCAFRATLKLLNKLDYIQYDSEAPLDELGNLVIYFNPSKYMRAIESGYDELIENKPFWEIQNDEPSQTPVMVVSHEESSKPANIVVMNPSSTHRGDWLYAIQSGESGPIKIGITKSVKSRLSGLQTSCPDKLRLLAAVPGSRDREMQIHNRLAKHRLNGEWFAPVPEVMELIEEVFVEGPSHA